MTLSRSTPLRRTAMRTKPTAARRVALRDLAAARVVVIERAGGKCERCGNNAPYSPFSVHHRAPRRSGGSRDPLVNTPSNLVLLCGTGTTGCHGEIESYREAARESGWLLSSVTHAERVAVRLWDGRWVRLTGDGCYTPVEVE